MHKLTLIIMMVTMALHGLLSKLNNEPVASACFWVAVSIFCLAQVIKEKINLT